jgi:hypothetical protein
VTGKDQAPGDAEKRRHSLRAPRKGDLQVPEILPRLLSPQRWVASGVLGPEMPEAVAKAHDARRGFPRLGRCLLA